MALQYSVDVRNAQLDAVETTIGASPLLRIFTGSSPANCAAASTDTMLVEFALSRVFPGDGIVVLPN